MRKMIGDWTQDEWQELMRLSDVLESKLRANGTLIDMQTVLNELSTLYPKAAYELQ